MIPNLVLSLFPGADLLGTAFQIEWPELCIVRGPDPIYNSLSDVRTFHPPSGVFSGVFGGPPCQPFSRLVHLIRANGYEPRHGNLIPEFERVIAEAQPGWFLMEEVPAAPLPSMVGYAVESLEIDARWVGSEQSRRRRFSFGTHDGRRIQPSIEYVALEPFITYETIISGNGFGSGTDYYRRVTTAVIGATTDVPVKMKRTFETRRRRSLEDVAELQGLPRDFLAESPLTASGRLQMLANGVPLPLGRAIARAVRKAMEATR